MVSQRSTITLFLVLLFSACSKQEQQPYHNDELPGRYIGQARYIYHEQWTSPTQITKDLDTTYTDTIYISDVAKDTFEARSTYYYQRLPHMQPARYHRFVTGNGGQYDNTEDTLAYTSGIGLYAERERYLYNTSNGLHVLYYNYTFSGTKK